MLTRNYHEAFLFRRRCLKIKKLFRGQKSLQYDEYLKAVSDLSVRQWRMELAPCPACSGTGCQGFAGPLPSAFLDKL